MSAHRSSLGALSACLLLLAACPASPPTEAAPDLAAAADLSAPADLSPSPDLVVPLRPLRHQDVTLIYPLPPPQDVTLMVWASTYSAYGRLIPQALFAQLPTPLDPRPGARTRTTDMNGWTGLRLVGVRLDPCFGSRGEVPDAECKNQIRLVFQGVQAVGDVSASDDGAIHALYELPRAELLTVAREILNLTERAGGYAPAPLGPHPVLQREGLRGAFAEGLKVLLMRHLGESRLVRMTFISRADSLLSSWHFGAFERKGDAFERADLVTTTTKEQTLITQFPQGGNLLGSTPTPTQHADNLLLLINGTLARAVDEDTRARAFGAALRIENPLRHTPDTIDCLSCHVAQAARTFGEQGFGLSADGHPDRFSGPGDLRVVPPPPLSLENVHALSYLGTELGLAQRTVNESAAVARRLTELLEAAEAR